jgi:hypothetical protein
MILPFRTLSEFVYTCKKSEIAEVFSSVCAILFLVEHRRAEAWNEWSGA